MEQETQYTGGRPIITFIIAGLMLIIGIFGMIMGFFAINGGFMDTHLGLPGLFIIGLPSFLIFVSGLLVFKKKRIGWWFLLSSLLIILLASSYFFLTEVYYRRKWLCGLYIPQEICNMHPLRSLQLILQFDTSGELYLGIVPLFIAIIFAIFLLIERKKFYRIAS